MRVVSVGRKYDSRPECYVCISISVPRLVGGIHVWRHGMSDQAEWVYVSYTWSMLEPFLSEMPYFPRFYRFVNFVSRYGRVWTQIMIFNSPGKIANC